MEQKIYIKFDGDEKFEEANSSALTVDNIITDFVMANIKRQYTVVVRIQVKEEGSEAFEVITEEKYLAEIHQTLTIYRL